MKVVALIDVHPLDGSSRRGLSMRLASNGKVFDLPISQDQASVLLANVVEQRPPAPAPPTPEEMNLFSQFAADTSLEEGDSDFYEDEDDDL